MLSRIANSLFWMGRYLERAQHSARFVYVHYYSALDAPVTARKEFLMDSISSMTGLSFEYSDNLKEVQEEELVYRVTLDENNPVSIKTSVFRARENARGARDVISSELWESINKFYHHVNSYKNKLSNDEILDFSEKVVDQYAVVKGYIDHSLVHDDTWSLIQLGIHMEAAAQLTRILISKVEDIQRFEKMKLEKAMESFQFVVLLKSVEAFDMSRVHYKSVPNLKNTLEFLILNKYFPRSIIYNLDEVYKNLQKIKIVQGNEKGSPEFSAGKIMSRFSFLSIEEVEREVLPFLERTLEEIYILGNLIDQKIS